MKKFLLILTLIFMTFSTFAADIESLNPNTTLSALWITAFLTAAIHTIAGPDHYLPFIAIAKSRLQP